MSYMPVVISPTLFEQEKEGGPGGAEEGRRGAETGFGSYMISTHTRKEVGQGPEENGDK